jgi:hypothetical protein
MHPLRIDGRPGTIVDLWKDAWDYILHRKTRAFLASGGQSACDIIAWRAGQIGALYGIRVYVPERSHIRRFAERGNAELPSGVKAAIDRSDFVLAVVTNSFDALLEAELAVALGRNKPVIPLVDRAVGDSALLNKFSRVLMFSRGGGSRQIENRLAEFLER